MLADGLEAEARAVYPYRSLNALQTVGYREFSTISTGVFRTTKLSNSSSAIRAAMPSVS